MATLMAPTDPRTLGVGGVASCLCSYTTQGREPRVDIATNFTTMEICDQMRHL